MRAASPKEWTQVDEQSNRNFERDFTIHQKPSQHDSSTARGNAFCCLRNSLDDDDEGKPHKLKTEQENSGMGQAAEREPKSNLNF